VSRLHFVDQRRRFKLGVNSVPGGVLGHNRERQDDWHIVFRLSRQNVAPVELPEIGVTGALDALLHIARTAVVGGHGQVPVSEHVVEIAQMLRGGMRGFFGILTLVDPPGMVQPVFVAAPGYELPDPASPRARKGRRLKGTFRLGQINEVLRQAFFAKHAGDHFAVTAGTAQAVFHDGPASRSLEKVQKASNLVGHRQWQIVRDVPDGLVRSFFEPRIDRETHLCDFIDGRGNRRRFVKAVPGPERLQFITVDGVDDTVKKFAEGRVAFGIVTALEDPVDGLVKVLACRFEMTRFEIGLASCETGFHLGNEIGHTGRWRSQNRRHRPFLLVQRKAAENRSRLGRARGGAGVGAAVLAFSLRRLLAARVVFRRTLRLVGSGRCGALRLGRARHMSLDRFFPGILATE
jgi:hypothetical protein